ncbi:MAG: response regulator [Roseiarcus sp.]
MNKRTILLVEDNPDDEALTLRALRKQEIVSEIVVVRDGSEAIDYLFATGTHDGRDPKQLPHLVLLDLKLPKVDGIGVLLRIRSSEITRLLPVVVLTSSNEQIDLVKSYISGANSYVRKPVNFEEFIEVTRQIGLYWLNVNQAAMHYYAPIRRED